MSPIRPYKISVYNRITGDMFAEYRSNQVPQRGDQISVYANHRNENDPFDLWGTWVVDAVVWIVAAPASPTSLEIARESGGYGADAHCDWVEVHVWPAEGPHWAKTPRFAKVLSPDEDEEGEDDEDSDA